jgi:hypothetical protein
MLLQLSSTIILCQVFTGYDIRYKNKCYSLHHVENICPRGFTKNKKFWKELICLLSLKYLEITQIAFSL